MVRVGAGDDVHDVVPFDDLGADAAATLGRFAELTARLRHVRRLATGRRTVGAWCDVLVEALGLLCATDRDDAWQATAVTAAIDDLRRRAADTGGDAVELDAADVVTLVDGIVAAHHGRLRLRTGAVTLCGLAPMRNVPARVVCILGFDEVSLRPPGIDGDDLLTRRPCVGEPDRRGERRQFVLDALLAADDHVVVVCDGSDITTNRTVRFAVQLSELLDTVDATLGHHGDGDSPIVVRHPLRSYDEANFADGALAPAPSPFGFDAAMRHAALVRRRADDARSLDLIERWTIDAPDPATTVTLAQLVQSTSRPARTLLRERLDLRLPGEVTELDTNIPLAVPPVQAAACGRRLLEQLRHEAPADEAAEAEVLARWRATEALGGRVPPGRLVDQALGWVEREVVGVIDAAVAELNGVGRTDLLSAPDSVEVDLQLEPGATVLPVDVARPIRLVDTIGHVVHTERFGSVLCRLSYTRPKARTYLEAAIHLAAAVAATGRTDWFAVSATRGAKGNARPTACMLGVTGQGDEGVTDARRLLEVAAELHLAARRAAVPLFEEASRKLHANGYLDEETLRGNDLVPGSGDLADADTGFVWRSVPVADILALQPSPADYARLLWGAVDAFVFEWSEPSTATGRRRA